MEQALVLASIVLGVGIAFELENLNRVLRSPQVRWHWAQPLFALLVLLTIISYWWGLARNPDGAITIGEFLPIMFDLVLLVLLAAASLPEKVGEEGGDLAAYYQANRRYQWILLTLFFWAVNLRWMSGVWTEASGIGQFLSVIAVDATAGLVVFAMIFVKRWWMVALGFAILSLGPVVWIGRTLG